MNFDLNEEAKPDEDEDNSDKQEGLSGEKRSFPLRIDHGPYPRTNYTTGGMVAKVDEIDLNVLPASPIFSGGTMGFEPDFLGVPPPQEVILLASNECENDADNPQAGPPKHQIEAVPRLADGGSGLRNAELAGTITGSFPRNEVQKIDYRSRIWNSSPYLRYPDYVIREKLFALGEAVATSDYSSIEQHLRDIRDQAIAYGKPIQRVVYYCMEALTLRLKDGVVKNSPVLSLMEQSADTKRALMALDSKSPTVGIVSDMSCKTFLESIDGTKKVHLIDFASWPQQWVIFIIHLARKFSPPPPLRFTMVMTAGSTSFLKRSPFVVEAELASAAQEMNLEFEMCVVYMQMENIHSGIFECREGEEVLVHSSMFLHHFPDSSLLRFNPRDKLLQAIHDINPRCFLTLELNLDLNSNFFLSRFKTLVHYFENFFAMLERSLEGNIRQTRLVEASYPRQQITNVIACEGLQRWFRPESLEKMLKRFQGIGFEVVPLSEDTVNSLEALMEMYPLYAYRLTDGVLEACSRSEGFPFFHHAAWRVAEK